MNVYSRAATSRRLLFIAHFRRACQPVNTLHISCVGAMYLLSETFEQLLRFSKSNNIKIRDDKKGISLQPLRRHAAIVSLLFCAIEYEKMPSVSVSVY